MFVRYIIAMTLAALAILFAIILGDYGPWYLSWLLGTGFMVLVAVSAGVLFEAQEDAAQAVRQGKATLDLTRVVEAPPPAHEPSR
jgi:predicted outer membrane lipoprotein